VGHANYGADVTPEAGERGDRIDGAVSLEMEQISFNGF
jgi:hypothetical protein